VRGLLDRGRLDELRALGGEAISVLERLRDGDDPALAAAASHALPLLTSP